MKQARLDKFDGQRSTNTTQTLTRSVLKDTNCHTASTKGPTLILEILIKPVLKDDNLTRALLKDTTLTQPELKDTTLTQLELKDANSHTAST